jgi:hypothetical protein
MGSSSIRQMTEKLLSLGDCPICMDSGAMLLLTSLGPPQSAIFYCPLCGVAWTEPPRDGRVDEIASLGDVAPSGVRLPTAAEALQAGTELAAKGTVMVEVPLNDWLHFLEDLPQWKGNLHAPPDG